MVELALTAGLVACGCALVGALIKISHLKDANAAQAKRIQALKEKCCYLKAQIPTGASPTTLRLTIFRQRELIEDLNRQIKQQKQLLNQKWVAAHTAYEEGATDGR